MFGLDKAKKAIKDQDAVIIVEGQMDVITCHQFGYQNTVASSGTALGPEQIKLIQRFTNNIVFAFDADAAGQLAADRGIKEALTAEMNIKIIIIPGAKDPDEAIRKNKDEWDKAVKNAEPLLEYFFNKTLSGLDLNKTADKRIATQKILDLVAKFTSKLEIDHWLKRLSAEIDIAENILWETLTKIKTKQNAKPIFKTNSVAPIVKTNSEESRLEKLSNLFLALLIKAPGLIEYALNNLDTDSLDNESLRAFYKSLIIYYNKSNDLNYANFRAYLAGSEVSYINLLDTLALLGDKDFADLDELEIKNELIKTISALKQTNFQTRLKDLERQIAMAERNKEADRVTALMGDFKTLSEQLKSLENN